MDDASFDPSVRLEDVVGDGEEAIEVDDEKTKRRLLPWMGSASQPWASAATLVLLSSVPAIEQVVLDGKNMTLELRNVDGELGAVDWATSRQARGACREEASALPGGICGASGGPEAQRRVACGEQRRTTWERK
jgi:hypothetical protein